MAPLVGRVVPGLAASGIVFDEGARAGRKPTAYAAMSRVGRPPWRTWCASRTRSSICFRLYCGNRTYSWASGFTAQVAGHHPGRFRSGL